MIHTLVREIEIEKKQKQSSERARNSGRDKGRDKGKFIVENKTSLKTPERDKVLYYIDIYI